MTTTSLPIDQLITVNATIQPATGAQRDFGRTLLITTDDNFRPGANRTQLFSRLEDVAKVAPTTSQPYLAARAYFSQAPYPRPLIIGRWADTASGARLRGGTPGTLAQIQALGNTNTLTIGGITTAAIDLRASAVGDFAAVATAVQGAIRTASALILAWVEATAYTAGNAVEGSDGNFFTAVLDNTGNDPTTDDGANWTLNGPNLDAVEVEYTTGGIFVLTAASNTAIHALPAGTIPDALGWVAADDAVNQIGYNADADIVAAFAAILQDNASWHWAAVDGGITDVDDLESLATTIQATGHLCMASVDVIGAAALVTNESASLAATLFGLQQRRVHQIWSATRDHKALSFAGRMSSVDFAGVQTAINPKGKQLPSTTPDNLTLTQVAELTRKRCNYYTRYGDTPIYAEGWTANNDTWVDVQYFLNWLTNDIQTRLFDLVIRHPTRLPQTEAGLASIQSECERACQQGVRNGHLAAGRKVGEAIAGQIRLAIGNPEFDGTLTQGYLVHVPRITTLSEAQRAARRAPSVSIWLAGSGAINYVTVNLVFAG